MRKEPEDRIDPDKPHLVVLYGATKRKSRPLAGELTVIGRNPGCDIGLVSPEVAPVHCVIVRLPGGWRIRDCSGRATRVNGRAIEEEPLNNGDVIQVGTFSFEAHLPPSCVPAPAAAGVAAVTPAVAPEAVARLRASRRRLAELALGLRRKVRDAEAQAEDLARREQDLAMLERRLRAASQDRAARAEKPEPPDQAEASARLEQRKAELDHYAHHLRRLEQKLREQERQQARQPETDRAGDGADLASARAEIDRERREVADLRREVEHRHEELEQTAALLEEELAREKAEIECARQELAIERAALGQQRQDLLRLRADLDRRADDPRKASPSTRDTVYDDLPPDRLAAARRLLHELAERRKALDQASRQG